MPSDAELLRRYAEERSEAAFAELVRRHVDLVYSAAVRQLGGDAHGAKDVAQVVFDALARKAGQLCGHPVLTGWLYMATQHATAKTRRAEIRRRRREKETQLMHDILGTEGSVTDWERVRPVLDTAMAELGERDREAVLLRYFERRAFADIGAALSVSEDAARMRVERALGKLHGLLTRRGVNSTEAALAVALGAHAVSAAPAGLAGAVTGGALASGAGGLFASMAGAGALTFMSTGKIAATVVVVAGLAGVGFGVRENMKSREAAGALSGITRERDALQARVRESEARLTQVDARVRELEATKQTVKPTSAPATVAQSVATVSGDPLLDPVKMKVAQAAAEKMALSQALSSNPEVQRLMVESQRLGLQVRLAPLYRMLNLTPDQVSRFEARMVQSYQDEADIGNAIRSQGLSPKDPAIARLAAEERNKLSSDVRGILGEAGYREYELYERTFGAREAVGSLLGNLVYAGAPLTVQQVTQLTQAVANHSPAFQSGGRVPGRGGDVAWERVTADAQSFLAPQQLDVVRTFGAQMQATAQTRELVESAMRKTVPGAAATGKPGSGG